MTILGKIISAPIKIINIPTKLTDRILDNEGNTISKVLDDVADEVEKLGDEISDDLFGER